MSFARNMSLSPGGGLPRFFSQLAILYRRTPEFLSCPVQFASKTTRHRRPSPFRSLHSMADSSLPPMEDTYHPEEDIEYLEDYVPGGYHPTLIGDAFCSGRYVVVHKLGFGGYSTIWLARDQQSQRYVSLKILTARASRESHEADILQHLMKGDPTHAGKRFIPLLLDQFSFDGPNGHHRCLIGEPAGCSISKSKEDSADFMFPPDAARSTAAQLLLGLSYLHASCICHGGMEKRHVFE